MKKLIFAATFLVSIFAFNVPYASATCEDLFKGDTLVQSLKSVRAGDLHDYRRIFFRDGQTVATLSISTGIDSRYKIYAVELEIENFPSDKIRLFIDTVASDVIMATRNLHVKSEPFSKDGMRALNVASFRFSAGYRHPTTVEEGITLFQAVDQALQNRLSDISVRDESGPNEADNRPSPDLKF